MQVLVIGAGVIGLAIARTAAQAFDQKLFRTGIVGHPFLRKHADLDVDAPGIVAGELFDRL